jgi:hypothetical protein
LNDWMDAPIVVCIITLKRERPVQMVYVRKVSVGDAANRQFITL